MLASRPELQRHPLGGAVAKAAANVVAANDEVLTVVGAPADQNMDVRVVGIPVIDREPTEPRAEVALDVLHQLAREGAQAFQVCRILGRDDEVKMVPVLLAALCEGLGIGVVGAGVEYASVRPIARDALALEVSHMPRQRRRLELRTLVANDTRHDRDPPARGTRRQRMGRPPSASEARAPLAFAALPEGPADVSGFLRGPHHLGDEALRSLATAIAVTDPSRPNLDVVVAGSHRPIARGKASGWRSDH